MNYTDIKNEVYFLTNTTSASYTDADINRHINKWYKKAVNWIEEASGLWEYDSSNKSNLPIATTDLVDGQQDYEIPTDARRINRVEVKDDSGDFNLLEETDESKIPVAIDEYYEEDGLPVQYDMRGQSIFLYPTPASDSVTTSGGLQITYSRNVDSFDTTATTTSPGFVEDFHEVLALGTALDFCVAKGLDSKEVDIRRQLYGGETTQGLKEEIEKFYGQRKRDKKTRLEVKTEDYS